MKLQILFFAFLAILLAGCSSSNTSDITGPGTTTSGIKTCLRSSDGAIKIPGGTKVIRKSDSSVVKVDANGCYEFPTEAVASGFLARSLAEVDSVQLYNDSALFAVTLPYITGNDTISIVPTIVTLQDIPNADVDSAFMVAYDKVHILSRKVRLRRADDGETSSFSRTLWSRDDGSTILVHFLMKGPTKTFSSKVYNIEPGALIFRKWEHLNTGSVPSLIHGAGSFVYHIVANPQMGVIEKDTIVHTAKASKIDTIIDTSVMFVSFGSKSIYGMRANGAERVDVSNINLDEIVSIPVTLQDSAGITTNDTIRIVKTAKRKVTAIWMYTPIMTYDGFIQFIVE